MFAASSDPSSGIQLRLFAPDNPPPALQPRQSVSPDSTLRQFYRQYVRPVCLENGYTSPRTIGLYDEAVRYWSVMVGDPPLASIDATCCAEFVRELQKLPGRQGGPLSPNTVRKHSRSVQFCLDRAGPPSPRCRNAAGLLDRVPWIIPPPKQHKPATDNFTIDEIRAWLEVCDRARVPSIWGLRPGAWWRALIRFTYNSGLRIGTMLGVDRSWVTAEAAGVGWLSVPGSSYKGGQGRRIFLSAHALAALAEIPTLGRVFPWPHGVGYLHVVRRRLLSWTMIPPERRFGFHGLRKALGSELFRINSGAARMQLGHTDEATTRVHYANPDVVGPALSQVPQP